jgi:ADP-ribose pyrophosphatase YjhB (NUDIX family)
VNSRLDPLWRTAMRAAYQLQLAWWFVRRPVIQGAYVAVWHGERVLLIQNSYRKRMSFPAGGLARGESMLDAAMRELHEEVGIRASAQQLAYHGEIVNPSGYAEDHAHIFELRCAEPPEVRVDSREVVWAEFMTPADALARGVVGVVRTYLERVIQR